MKKLKQKNIQTLQLRRHLFEAVRDIPYKIDHIDKASTCLAKNKLLGELLMRTGLKCRIVRAESYWKDTPKIPPNILALAPKPKFGHVFLEVFIPETNKWIRIDATWDPKLGSTFPIAKWDGLHDTILACKIKNPIRVGNPSDYPYRDFDPKDNFTKKLNMWYTSLRKNKNVK